MKASTFWFAVAGGAGYLAYREYQRANEQARVAYAAQQQEQVLSDQAAAAGTCSPIDGVKAMAVQWLQQQGASITLGQLQTFLQSVQSSYIPSIVAAWSANGLSTGLFVQLAQSLNLGSLV